MTPLGATLDSGGAIASIAVSVQLVTCAEIPLNVTDAPPDADDPKLLPVIRTDVPGIPDAGMRLLIVGEAADDPAELALPITGAQTITVKIRISDSKEVTRVARFIRSSFKQCEAVLVLRTVFLK